MLLIGADSEIGAATSQRMSQAGHSVRETTRRPERASGGRCLLDLSQALNDWMPPAGTRAACIFAAIARLAVCAEDPAGSAFVNVTQTLALVDRLLDRGVHVVFLSTNQVFDGTTPHTAPDAPFTPVSEYGRQKARTETALIQLMAGGAPVTILRLSKIVSPDMALVQGWAKTLARGEPIRAFSDMTMAPAPTALAADAIAALMQARKPGIFQLTGPIDVTYADVGRHVAERVGAGLSLVEAVPAASAGMPIGATPANTTLDSSALGERFGITAPEPWDVIDPVIQGMTPSLR